jgi:hypothetical protein
MSKDVPAFYRIIAHTYIMCTKYRGFNSQTGVTYMKGETKLWKKESGK